MSSRFNSCNSNTKSHGFTLIELMVAMVIGTIVMAAAISLFKNSMSQNHSITHRSHLQEESFFLSHILRQQIAQIGYRPIINSRIDGRILPIDDRETAFPEVPSNWESGQTLSLTDTAMSYRYYGASNEDLEADSSIYDCLGNSIPDGEIEVNQIALVDNQLVCTTEDETGVILGADQNVLIEQLKFSVGIDDNDDQVIDRTIDATSASSADFVKARQLILHVLLATPDRVAEDNQVYHFDGVEHVSTDRKLRVDSEISMALRN